MAWDHGSKPTARKNDCRLIEDLASVLGPLGFWVVLGKVLIVA